MTKIISLLVIMLSAAAFAETLTVPATVPIEPSGMNNSADVDGAVKTPKVMFVEPKDGAAVARKFTVKMAVEGMKVAPAGKVEPLMGHHHLIIDGGPVKRGEAIPNDATHLHFGKGQTETMLDLKPGKHTLTLQFADGAHISYGDMMSQTIHITVK